MRFDELLADKLNILKMISNSDDIHVVLIGKDGTDRLNTLTSGEKRDVKFVHFECVYSNEYELANEITDLKRNGFILLRSYEDDGKITAMFEHVGDCD